MSLLMVIDDEEANVLIFEENLKRIESDMEVIHFNNVVDALEYLSLPNSIDPELIFLDIYMPKKDGWYFLEIYENEKLSAAPVYVVSSSYQSSDKARSKEYASVQGYVEKPFKFHILNGILLNHTLK